MVKDTNNPKREDQWDIIQLYQIFVFRKGKQVENSSSSKKGNYRNERDKNRYFPVLRKNRIEFKDYNPVFIEDTFE